MKFLRLFIVAFLLSVAGAFAALYFGWDQLNQQVEVDSTKLVEIPQGATSEQALDVLENAGMLRSKLPLRIYMKLTGAGPRVKAGDYYFPSPISPLVLLHKLEEGGQGANKITVIEGWNRWDIANALILIPTLKLKNTDEALKFMDDAALVKDLDPGARNLEGYLFPDTYFVYSTNSAEDLIEEMVKQFKAVWDSKLATRARDAHRTVHDVVTVASIVETEAKLPEERPVVASVIYNRIAKKMPLAVDSTIVYASKMAGKWKNDGKVYQSDIDRDSPYNTRRVKGLPPGPVSSPGVPSMEAAINPANTAYLYYVRNPSRNDGAHNFYTNPADFEKGVQALRDWEQSQKLKAAKHR